MAGGFKFEGVDTFERVLAEWSAKMEAAARSGLSEAAHAVQRSMQDKANTGRHAVGVPTTAVPGSGPNVVTGNLRRSIRVGPIVSEGRGFATEVGPTAIYGRRVELEYDYPYAGPGLTEALPGIAEIFHRAWSNAQRR